MDEKFLVLRSSLRNDLAAIEQIYVLLDNYDISEEAGKRPDKGWDYDQLIVVAYHLHNLYNAFENIFLNIATAFENSIEELGRWHAQLLERMKLDVSPLRPAVIDTAAYDALDELRRFRHVFRHAYSITLDADRLDLVLRKAAKLRNLYRRQMDAFDHFLQDLSDS